MIEKTGSLNQEKLATDQSADETLTYEQAEAVLLAFASPAMHPGPSRTSIVPENPIPLEHVPEVFQRAHVRRGVSAIA